MRVGGFTLIETLIALALLAAISFTSLSALGLANRVWSSVDQHGQSLESLRLTQELVSGWLRQTRPEPVQRGDQLIPPLTGDQSRIELITPLSAHAGHPGLYLVRLEKVQADPAEDEQTDRLIVHYWLLHPEVVLAGRPDSAWQGLSDSQDPGWIRAVDEVAMPAVQGKQRLLTGVEDFKIRYFGIHEQRLEPAWHDQWMGRMDMPQAVEFRVLARDLPETSGLIRLSDDLSLASDLSLSRDGRLLRDVSLSRYGSLDGSSEGTSAR